MTVSLKWKGQKCIYSFATIWLHLNDFRTWFLKNQCSDPVFQKIQNQALETVCFKHTRGCSFNELGDRLLVENKCDLCEELRWRWLMNQEASVGLVCEADDGPFLGKIESNPRPFEKRDLRCSSRCLNEMRQNHNFSEAVLFSILLYTKWSPYCFNWSWIFGRLNSKERQGSFLSFSWHKHWL